MPPSGTRQPRPPASRPVRGAEEGLLPTNNRALASGAVAAGTGRWTAPGGGEEDGEMAAALAASMAMAHVQEVDIAGASGGVGLLLTGANALGGGVLPDSPQAPQQLPAPPAPAPLGEQQPWGSSSPWGDDDLDEIIAATPVDQPAAHGRPPSAAAYPAGVVEETDSARDARLGQVVAQRCAALREELAALGMSKLKERAAAESLPAAEVERTLETIRNFAQGQRPASASAASQQALRERLVMHVSTRNQTPSQPDPTHIMSQRDSLRL